MLAIKAVLDQLMNDPGTGVEIRLNELYDHARRVPQIAAAFPTPKSFSQFLRAEHNNLRMKAVIPNYTVDTFIHSHYEWKFHREVIVSIAAGEAEALMSNDRYRDHKKNILTASGELVRSHQERFIHDALNRVSHFRFRYEFPLHAFGSNKNVEFHIQNVKTGKEYFWEHFGMTNSEYYKDGVVKKLEWYKDAGFKPLEEGGAVIFTYYRNEHDFHRSVQRIIERIR